MRSRIKWTASLMVRTLVRGSRHLMPEQGAHVGPRQNLLLDQMFEKRERGHAVGDGDGLVAAA